MQVGCALEHQLAPDEDVLSSWVVSCDTLTNIKSLKILEDDSQLSECKQGTIFSPGCINSMR